jgi:hypothetical protein
MTDEGEFFGTGLIKFRELESESFPLHFSALTLNSVIPSKSTDAR